MKAERQEGISLSQPGGQQTDWEKRNLPETHAPVQAGDIKDEISPEQQFISNWEERDSLTFSCDQGLHTPVSRSLTGVWLPVCLGNSCVCVYVCVCVRNRV